MLFRIVIGILFFCACSTENNDEIRNSLFFLSKYELPVITRSKNFPDWKGLAVSDATVIEVNDTLKAWYTGSGWLSAEDQCPNVRIGYSWSLDGINWIDYTQNPVLDKGNNIDDFDFDGVETPTVIYDSLAPINERYKLWYAGRNLSCSSVQDHKIGYAFSSDGINWIKYSGNPIIVPGDSDSFYNTAIYGPSVIFENDIYKMWFTGLDLIYNDQSTDGKANIFFATSNDGMNWIVDPLPVLEAGSNSANDTFVCAEPSVVKVNNTYHMFYSVLEQWEVENFKVGYAWSFDGISWVKSNQNPILTTGGVYSWDYYWASHPTVIYNPSTSKIRMWYTGRDSQSLESFYDYYWDIGYAEFQFQN